MNRNLSIVRVVLAALVLFLGCSEGPETETDPADAANSSLPVAAVPLAGWQLQGEPQVVVGDALFELINGGAELYHEHGFVQAMAADYTDEAGRAISLEVFEMKDLLGAREVFAEKSRGSGEFLAVGDEAAFEEYYLNVRTGPFLITVTGFDTDEQTTEGILRLAESVVNVLGGSS
jgi:hypothetical protein